MSSSICGIDCNECELKDSCGGCNKTNECMLVSCCNNRKYSKCNECVDMPCKLKHEIIDEFNSLGIKDMDKVTDLNALKGFYVNLSYPSANGEIKLLDDNKIYLGNQICKKGTDRCYGLAADEKYILVCEYGVDGIDPEIVIYKRRVNK